MNVIWLKNKNACMESIVIPYTFICRLKCEQVLFVYVFTIIPPRLTDQRNFIIVLIVTREPEQTTFCFEARRVA